MILFPKEEKTMLKKVLFVMLVLLVATTCFAQLQSGPSNKVGYVKIPVTAGTISNAVSTPFGLPFKFWDCPGTVPQYGVPATNGGTYRPSYIIGDQLVHGISSQADRIAKQGGSGLYAYINNSSVWTGTLETAPGAMEPGRAYWFANRHAATNLVLAGEVANTALDSIITIAFVATGSVSTPLSWRISRVDSVKTLNLVGTPYGNQFLGGTSTTSDRIVEQGAGGGYSWYRTSDNTWPLTTSLQVITPGKAYWITNKHNHGWTYRWLGTGIPFSTQVDHKPMDPSIQKVTPPAVRTESPKTKIISKK